jgi:hypothetical protein
LIRGHINDISGFNDEGNKMRKESKQTWGQIGITCMIVTLFIVPIQGLAAQNDTPPLISPVTKKWTTLYYLDVDYTSNNYDPLDRIFLDEIASTENINVVVIQDKEDDPAYLYYIDENHNKILLEELGEVNMGSAQTLSYFINYGKENYPADRYLLWVYNHGGGWKGACMDDSNGDPLLSMDEFQIALTETGGVDIICFFACLMSSLESVYELRDLVDVYIGSEDLGYGEWWNGICGDTNQLIDSSPDIPSTELGIEIVNFFPDHPNFFSKKLTMSAIQTDKVEALVEALDSLVQSFMSTWFRSYRKVRVAHDATFLLADLQSWADVFEVYDLKSFIQNLPSTPEVTAVSEVLDKAIIAEVHGSQMTETHGLSIFFPSHVSPYGLVKEYKDEELGLDFPRDTLWNEFLFFFIATNTVLLR